MPIPTPQKEETESHFISRCMHVIGDEYEDKKQAVAVCYDSWRKVHGGEPPSEALIEKLLEESKRHVRTTFPFFPFKVTESLAGKPTKITGIAMKVGRSRNDVPWDESKVKEMGKALIGAPIYGEHISVFDSIGKVSDAWYQRPFLYYEGEVWDEDFGDKIRRGLIRHVSPAADYKSFEIVNGRVPVGFPTNAELSLVAVAGIPETNIKVMERLDNQITARKPPSNYLELKTEIK